jgi:acetate kinase
MEFLGIKLNEEKNKSHQEIISEDSSKVKVMRIPTNEELVIALDTNEIVKGMEVKNHAH